MLNWEAWMNIKHLQKQGHSIKAITRLTGHSRNTVRRVLRQPKPAPFNTPARSSCLDEFKPYVEQRYQECALSTVRLFQEIRAMGYTGSAVTLYRLGTATLSFVYDAAGNRTQRTDYNNAVTNYSFDSLNRLTTISYPDTTSVTFGYDVLSRMTTATNPTGTVTLGYDNRGRASSVTDVFGQVVSYSYDANSNRTQLSLNAATSATYQYDNINRLTQLADSASLNTTFNYDVTNKLTSRTLPNGVVTTSQYDDLNRLTRLTHAKSGNTLADFQYQLDAASNITQMTDNIGVHGYTYDTRDRLTAVTHSVASNESYTLDDVGNRTASHQGSSYTYQSFNRLIAANSNTFAYDGNGNLTSKTDGSGSWIYTWDYENRLKQVSKSGGVTVTYSYDALGRRIQRTSSVSGTTRFVYYGDDVIRDLDGSGATVADYLNGPGVDNKLRQVVGGNTSYFVTDHLLTTRALADSSGAVVSSISYDSYGNVSSGSASTRYTYTGRESDAETGLTYYRARWYDSAQGRFISEDPIGLKGGINLFGYVANNPARFTDPSGLCPQNSGSFDDCFRSSGLATARFRDPMTGQAMQDASEFWSGAADALLEINQYESGASLSLLAVTWMNESSFAMRGLPNTNGSQNTKNWDYGPFQLNERWTNAAINLWVTSKGKRGVSDSSLPPWAIYGSISNANEGFDGDVVANGRMAARILLATGGRNDRERAQRYTSVVNQRVRGISYDNYAPLFEKFFKCYRGGDSKGLWK
jgi:RHS repeat-associated protein